MRNRQRQDSKPRSTQRKIFVILVSWCLCAGFLGAQTTVNINDTLRNADNSLASGRLEIFWPAFKTSDGFTVAPGRLSYTVTNGVVNLSLFPNAGGTPVGHQLPGGLLPDLRRWSRILAGPSYRPGHHRRHSRLGGAIAGRGRRH